VRSDRQSEPVTPDANSKRTTALSSAETDRPRNLHHPGLTGGRHHLQRGSECQPELSRQSLAGAWAPDYLYNCVSHPLWYRIGRAVYREGSGFADPRVQRLPRTWVLYCLAPEAARLCWRQGSDAVNTSEIRWGAGFQLPQFRTAIIDLPCGLAAVGLARQRRRSGACDPAARKELPRASMETRHFQIDRLKVEVHPDKESAGRAAAQAAGEHLSQLGSAHDRIGVVFATGASQLAMLRALISARNIPWDQIHGFHMDEYVGIDENHPASFRHYLRENLTSRVHMRAFNEIDGSSPDPGFVCRDYAEKLRSASPQLCLLGIGENGHLAFNDPAEADFHDPADVKIVTLDSACRQQQTAEGWFGSIEEVPAKAITVTIPALVRIPRLILSVPGKRKAEIVRRAFHEPISTHCPATILRTHPDATVYLDMDSAAELGDKGKIL